MKLINFYRTIVVEFCIFEQVNFDLFTIQKETGKEEIFREETNKQTNKKEEEEGKDEMYAQKIVKTQFYQTVGHTQFKLLNASKKTQ